MQCVSHCFFSLQSIGFSRNDVRMIMDIVIEVFRQMYECSGTFMKEIHPPINPSKHLALEYSQYVD